MTGPANPGREAELQHDYYVRTAAAYDSLHDNPGDEHYRALAHISAVVGAERYESILDVGTGTGRGVKYLLDHHPELRVAGVEPVAALIEQARARGIPDGVVIQGRGEQLPFDSDSFDAVCELSVLHHVREPNAVVAEMTRVARRAVFLSDVNRFGWGSLPRRLGKLALHRLRLWQPAVRLKTRGRGYMLSEEDGVSYSYSVFDSYDLLREWADEIFVIPTIGRDESWRYPLLTADHVLLCALRG